MGFGFNFGGHFGGFGSGSGHGRGSHNRKYDVRVLNVDFDKGSSFNDYDNLIIIRLAITNNSGFSISVNKSDFSLSSGWDSIRAHDKTSSIDDGIFISERIGDNESKIVAVAFALPEDWENKDYHLNVKIGINTIEVRLPRW